jgi:hypothetical protein
MKANRFFSIKTALECKVEFAERQLEKHLENTADKPKNLRPAKASDIVEGAIIWYPKWEDSDHPIDLWKEVYEVKWPDDAFKAYTAHDGCRYGLDGAFVEDES